MYKLTFTVPETHAEAVKQAVFAAGAGDYGNYDCCAWQTLGKGQFRPLEGSRPFLGREGEVAQVPELRVEMICAEERAARVRDALLDAHPYDVPAYDFVPILSIPNPETPPHHANA